MKIVNVHWKKEEEDEEEDSDSVDSFGLQNDIYFKTRPNNSSSEIKIKKDNLVKAYSYSPFLIYEVLDNIDSGAYGSVQRVCFKKRKEIVRAIKIIDKDSIAKGQTDRLFEEIEILRKLEHPNIMKIYEYYNRKNNIYIISEYLDEGTLLDKLSKLYSFSELVVKYLMSQILDG